MPTTWIRGGAAHTSTSALSLVDNGLVYNNARTVTGSITLVQKVTVVAMYLFGITNTDDTWSVSVLVVDEAITPTYSGPQLQDPELKGQFMFARGPLLYQPKRLISVPSESSLMIRTNKELGGNSSTFNIHFGFLLQMTL